MASAPSIRPGQLIARLISVVTDNAVPAGIAITVLTVLITAADLYASEGAALFLSGVATMIAQYLVLRYALGRLDLLANDLTGAVGAFILASVLIGVGLVLGLIALIVPSVILALRWSPALPLILGAERMKAADALGEAMRLTRGQALAILPAFLLSAIPNVASLVVMFTLNTGEGPMTVTYGAINVLGNIGLVASIYLSVAVYLETLDPDRDVRSVFA